MLHFDNFAHVPEKNRRCGSTERKMEEDDIPVGKKEMRFIWQRVQQQQQHTYIQKQSGGDRYNRMDYLT